jgi:hypothetical protein
MPENYLNPFKVYGSRHSEDNVTRAWLATLQELAPAHARIFLHDVLLADHPHLRERIDFTSPDPLSFDFQVSQNGHESGDLKPTEGALITIDASGDDELTFEGVSADGGARPDGMIIDRGSGVTVILEVKLYARQRASQLTRHHAAFFDTSHSNPEDVRCSVRWTHVAEYMDRMRERGTSEHERFMLTSFVDYAESLGLAPFRGFRDEHFEEQDGTTLRKYMRAVWSTLRDRGLKVEWDEGRAPYVGFTDRRDNLWVNYEGRAALRFGIVSGADSKSTCAALKKALEERPDQFDEFGRTLQRQVQQLESAASVAYRPHRRIYFSRFRNWTLPPREQGYTVTDAFEVFRDDMLDDARNPLNRISREKVTERFEKELAAAGKERGPDGLFPPPLDADPVLVQAYLHIGAFVPVAHLLEMDRDTAIELGADLCSMLYRSLEKLEEMY